MSFKLLTRALFTGIFLLVIGFTTFFCGKYRTNFFMSIALVSMGNEDLLILIIKDC